MLYCRTADLKHAPAAHIFRTDPFYSVHKDITNLQVCIYIHVSLMKMYSKFCLKEKSSSKSIMFYPKIKSAVEK